MNHPCSRLLASLPPLVIGAGFAIRTTLSDRPPVSIVNQLQDLSFAWAVILEVLCFVAAIMAWVPDREWSIKLRATLSIALAAWAGAIAVAVFFKEPDPGQTQSWWYTREYTTTGTGAAVALFFLADWWDQIHFRLTNLRNLEALRSAIEKEG